VLTVADIARRMQVTLIERAGQGVDSAIERLRRQEREFGVLVDRQQQYSGVVTLQSLDRARRDGQGLAEARVGDVQPLRADQSLSDVLTDVARAPTPMPVVDGDGRYIGTVSRAILLEALAGIDEQERAA